jgi:CelD/BcsL family acetyltransferase involved in cellulose biosynthesis
MQYSVIPAGELSLDLMERWSRITKENALYRSPSLRPEVFQTVGRFNARVFIGLEETTDGASLFFPFERTTRLASFAGSVPMCDYQAFIASLGHPVIVSQLMRAWKLKTWTFEHLIAPPNLVAQTTTLVSEVSHRVVLQDGFAGYLAEMAAKGKSTRKDTNTKLRLLSRDHGEVRFVPDCRDQSVLTALFDWKAQRFNGGDGLAPWARSTVDALYATRTSDFSGMLAALYIGDQLAAAHFGVRSDETLYYWFPAFNPEFGKYSPGWLLIVFLLRHLHVMGCDTLDFGPGGEKYKKYFANTAIPVCHGFVELPSVGNLGRATWRSTRGLVRRSRTARLFLRPVIDLVRRRQ